MRIQTLLKTLAAVIVLGGSALILVNQWRYQSLGGIEVRRHGLTGAIQLKQDGTWVAPAYHDGRAPALPAALLKSVQIEPPTGSWGDDQLVAFTAVTQKPLKGRLAVRIVIRDSQNRVIVRGDKSLRLTVDWPGGARVPVALNTTMNRPDFPHTIVVRLENIDQQEGT
jgi:hypothetical protein